MSRIGSLWIGDRLSAMEQLSIRSFLANGHEFHLYTYGPMPNVPEDAIQHDANEILPASKIFRYRDCGSYSGFSNHFRYKLLLEKGGWWADLDVVCLRPIPTPEEYAFASEFMPDGSEAAAPGVMFSHPGAKVIEYLWDVSCRKDPEKIVWCETGPLLMREAVRRFDLARHLLPAVAFCPVPFSRWYDTFVPGRCAEFGPETFGVHLWHEMWRRAELDKDEDYGPRSLYEKLKARYGISGLGQRPYECDTVAMR